jgi:hypothetical protein
MTAGLAKVSFDAVLETVPDAGHFDFIHPVTAGFQRLLSSLPLAVEEQ